MKKLILTSLAAAALFSCTNSIDARYDTLQVKKLYLEGDNGKKFELSMEKDSTGKKVLAVHEVQAE